MKYSLLTLALIAGAGPALAQSVTTPPVGSISTPSVSTPSVTAPSVTAPSVSTPSVATPSVSTPSVAAPSVATPSLGSNTVTAPSVPNVSTPSVPNPNQASLPSASGSVNSTASATGNAGVNASRNGVSSSGKLSAKAAHAQQLILKDGYTNVQNVTANADGSYSATANRGGQQVQVKVGSNGRVSTP